MVAKKVKKKWIYVVKVESGLIDMQGLGPALNGASNVHVSKH